MPDGNSYAEFVLGAYRALLVDCARQYPELAKEFDRDYKRLSSAIDSHGVRFALDVMPAFRKHLDKCLSEQRLTPSGLTHFGTGKKGEVIPRLFRGLTLRVFDRSGLLKDQPDTGAVRWLRQLLGVVRKLRMESSVKDRGDTIRDFYRIDMSVRSGDLTWADHETFSEEVDDNTTSFEDAALSSSDQTDDLFDGHTDPPTRDIHNLHILVQQVADLVTSKLGSFDPHEWSFRHGPGSVSDQPFGNHKYDFKRWPVRLESVFPCADFAFANFSHVDIESIQSAASRGFFHESPAKLHAVPKTIKTPRLIAAEPNGLQWCQQAVRSFLYDRVDRSILAFFVDFRRQDLNGSLALSASLNGMHSTIDLSSASDRISCWHIERLFRRSPSLLRALQACRSVWIEQDICKYSPRYHYLRKYSTQGNATTFPVQTLFFLTLALASYLHVRGQKATYENLRAIGSRQVRVFGDDIIVPRDCSGTLVGLLETLKLKVNVSKTFTVGNFRESCGVDGYRGDLVTTVNILDKPSRASPSSIVSSVDAHNNLLDMGYMETAAFIRKTARFNGFTQIREVRHGDGAFGWWTYGVPSYDSLKRRMNKDLQRPEVKCLQHTAAVTRRPSEGNPGLLQFFTEAAKKVTSASSTLYHLVRRPKSRLTLRWAPI